VNAVAWICLKAQLAEAESATDEFVLDLGVKPADYAEILLQIAPEARFRLRFAFSGVLLMKSPRLDARIHSVLNPNRRTQVSRSCALLAIGSLLLASAPCAVLQVAN
jgi:hypothetical protein